MSQVAGEALLSKTQADTLLTKLVSDEDDADTGSELCNFAEDTRSGDIYKLTVVGKGDLTDKYSGRFCVNSATGRKKQATNETATPPADADVDCS